MADHLLLGIKGDTGFGQLNGENTFTTKDGFVDWTIGTQIESPATLRGRHAALTIS